MVHGGQLTDMDTGACPAPPVSDMLAVNAYLGGWGIKTALDEGADIVITGRVADASMITGPAAWWHGWNHSELNKIAGAIAAGHILECGPQATGGNFSGFTRLRHNVLPGFPIAEIAEDGSSVITKRASEGGSVTVDTVTAQLMYEIQGPVYLNPDANWHVNSVSLSQVAPDRVRVFGARGSAPSPTTKVNIHHKAGYRGAMWVFPTGLRIDEKVAVLEAQASLAAQDHELDELRFFVCGRQVEDPRDQWEATVPVQLAVAAGSEETVRRFLAQFASYWLGSIPGFYTEITRVFSDTPQARIDYTAALVPQSVVQHRVHLPDGRILDIAPPPRCRAFTGQPAGPTTRPTWPGAYGPTVRRPLGDVMHARAGDKGADANLGVWVSDPAAYPWLASYLTTCELCRLLGLDGGDTVERYEQPSINGISFVLKGYFTPSGSANLVLDQIGKSLGEFLLARHADIPCFLLDTSSKNS
ncbi:acyclic terpene utilization AtuA family protein [Streptomyces sp. b94]|uniref:acyclic terpene utilization AtuA family protein n=1 Tax=Streptomyces sp. b94 TaxID=1827634 RepID=UPI001FFCC7E4|nr:acyclic terpene utilization AtuA family protein [Streptomyces sp. b94]